MAAKKWAGKLKLKEGALGPLTKVTVAEMLADPKKVSRVNVLANLGNVKAKALMAQYRKAKASKKK